jgi:DNA replication protein DnaC
MSEQKATEPTGFHNGRHQIMAQWDSTHQSLQPVAPRLCPHCKIETTATVYNVGNKPIYIYKQCECEGAVNERKIAENERISEEVMQKFSSAIMASGGIHEGRYSKMTFTDWDLKRNKHAAGHYEFVQKFLSEMDDDRNMLWLYGSYGTGKTHLAIASLYEQTWRMAKEYVNNKFTSEARGCSSFYAEWSIHCSTVQQSWDGQGTNERTLWGRMRTPRILVIDDIDKRIPSEWALGKLYEVVNYRYMHQLPTVITANHSLADLGAEWAGRGGYVADIGGAIISRLIGQLWGQRNITGGDQRIIG